MSDIPINQEEIQAHSQAKFLRGEGIYKTIAAEVEKKYLHQFIAINVENGEYLVSANDLEVLRKAKDTFPAGAMYFRRVGEPSAAYSFGG